MTNPIKWIKNKVLASEIEELATEKARWQQINDDWKERLEASSIIDLVQARLKIFDPKLLDSEQDILAEIEGEEAQLSFLRHMSDLSKNEPWQRLLKKLIRDQLIFTGKEARNIREINFGRATINGYEIMRDEVDRYAAIYKERTTLERDYDKFSAMPDT